MRILIWILFHIPHIDKAWWSPQLQYISLSVLPSRLHFYKDSNRFTRELHCTTHTVQIAPSISRETACADVPVRYDKRRKLVLWFIFSQIYFQCRSRYQSSSLGSSNIREVTNYFTLREKNEKMYLLKLESALTGVLLVSAVKNQMCPVSSFTCTNMPA